MKRCTDALTQFELDLLKVECKNVQLYIQQSNVCRGETVLYQNVKC